MVSGHHIREALARYLSDEITLLEFQEWFVPRAWEVIAATEAPQALRDLAAQIELLLAEYTGGYQTDAELRQALKHHAHGSVVMVTGPDPFLRATTWTQPWLEQAATTYRWTTSAAGAESGNSTVDVRSSAVIEPRIEKSEEVRAA